MAFVTELFPMSDRDFERIREMAYAACGLSLHSGKRALVSSRLERLVRRSGRGSFANYLDALSRGRDGDEFIEFIDNLTTNHSGFWREPEHFRFLQSVMAKGSSTPRIWSAACATGEEPYTIAMCASESEAPHCRILATDISRKALKAAESGVYEEARLRGLPAGWQNRYFKKAEGAKAEGCLRVSEKIRALVTFRSLNLLQSFQHLGNFETIFCRNVMIYFDQQTRDDLVARLAAQLVPGGHLLTGHSETLLRVPTGLQYVQPAIYRKC